MLGFRVSRLTRLTTLPWWDTAVAALAVAMLGISLWEIYKEAFPQLKGGSHSLIYFREIASRTEAGYLEAFKEQSDSHYVNDLLGQVWRNSEILKEKYNHLKIAFIFLALAIPPWAAALALFAANSVASHVAA